MRTTIMARRAAPIFGQFFVSAEEAFQNIRSSMPLLTLPQVRKQIVPQHLEKVYVPFWSWSFGVHSKFRGTVACVRTWEDSAPQPSSSLQGNQLNQSNSPPKRRKRVVWVDSHGWHDIGDASYDNHHIGQVYAGYRFDRNYLDAIRKSVKHCHLYGDARPEAGCRVEPFEMWPNTSWNVTWARLQRHEEEFAVEALKRYYDGFDVRDLHLATTLLRRQLQPIYMPAYVLRVETGSRHRRLFVDGVSGQVTGDALTATSAVATASGAAAMLATGLIFPEPTIIAFSGAFAASLAGGIDRWKNGMKASAKEAYPMSLVDMTAVAVEDEETRVASLSAKRQKQEDAMKRVRVPHVKPTQHSQSSDSPPTPGDEGDGTSPVTPRHLTDDEQSIAQAAQALGLEGLEHDLSVADVRDAFRRVALQKAPPSALPAALRLTWPDSRSESSSGEWLQLCRAYRTLMHRAKTKKRQ